MIFADGTGQGSDFDGWATDLAARLCDPFGSGDGSARVWAVCKQSDRRTVLATRLASARARLHWLDGVWHSHWCELANLEVDPAPALLALEARINSAGAVARSRVLFGGAAGWPDGDELAVLRLWPSARGRASIRFQAAISLGAQALDIVTMLPALLELGTRSWSREDNGQARYFVRYLGRDFVRGFGRDFVRDFVRYLGWDFVRYLGRDFVGDFVRYFVRDFGRYLGWGFVRYFVGDFVRDFVRDFGRYLVRGLGRDFAGDFVQELGLAGSGLDAPWLSRFVILELGSVGGRAATRAALAHGEVPESSLLALFRAACQASFLPDDARLCAAVVRACEAFDGDPLWPALARHVARISTPEDRALLEDLARHPEQRQAPLAWGLQYYVRGDLAFDDDSVVTIDELCARAGRLPLPLLEAMPDELDLPLDDASP